MNVDVLVLMGSPSDWERMREAGAQLDALKLSWEAHVASAHRTPDRVAELVREAEEGGAKVVICGAGMAAHLAGVVASLTLRPVIGVPLPGGLADGLDALLSTVQMPGGVPVATVAVGKAGAKNAAVLAAEIIAVSDGSVAERLRAFREAQRRGVADADKKLGGGRGTP
jgi:5-(carboxyamino)imidazole ribonucleotide mutase